MILRPERADEHEQIAAVVAAAFDDGRIAQLVADLRAWRGYLPELALVAEADGEVVGHVMFTQAMLAGEAILNLSPLAVRPDRQRRGIGAALVERGLAACRARPEPLVIVEGNPGYYSRFGFVDATTIGVHPPDGHDVPPRCFQAIVLRGDHPRGRVEYPPAFDGL